MSYGFISLDYERAVVDLALPRHFVVLYICFRSPSYNVIFLWWTVASVHLRVQLLSSLFWSTAEELSSLFEKKNFRVKSPCSGKQSILSVRLEQCPLQLNNPFNEYSKFDGKVSGPHVFLPHPGDPRSEPDTLATSCVHLVVQALDFHSRPLIIFECLSRNVLLLNINVPIFITKLWPYQ